MTSLKILGVTDPDFIRWLKDHTQTSFTILFDLRPRSFQFLQQHKCLEIMEEFKELDYGIVFDGEKDFLIKQFSEEVLRCCSRNEIKLPRFYFLSKVSTSDDLAFGDNFVFPMGCRLEVAHDFKSNNIDFIISAEDVIQDIISGQISKQIKLQSEYLSQNHKFPLLIKNQHEKYLAQIREYMSFDELILEIDQELLLSYRQVDYVKMKEIISRIYNENFTD